MPPPTPPPPLPFSAVTLGTNGDLTDQASSEDAQASITQNDADAGVAPSIVGEDAETMREDDDGDEEDDGDDGDGIVGVQRVGCFNLVEDCGLAESAETCKLSVKEQVREGEPLWYCKWKKLNGNKICMESLNETLINLVPNASCCGQLGLVMALLSIRTQFIFQHMPLKSVF